MAPFANAMVGGDFSEDYFKKFEINKIFKMQRTGAEIV